MTSGTATAVQRSAAVSPPANAPPGETEPAEETGRSATTEHQDDQGAPSSDKAASSAGFEAARPPLDADALHAEVIRLRARSRALEKALQTMKEEGHAIQAAAQAIVSSGQRLQNVSNASPSGSP